MEYVRVDMKEHKFKGEDDFYALHPNGYIPFLELDDGNCLTEGPTIIQFFADLKPEAALAPANGTLTRAQLQQSLRFLSSEIHQVFRAVIHADKSDRYFEASTQKLARHYGWIDNQLASNPYLQGERFTVADAYLFALTGWANASWLTTYIDSGFSVENLGNLRAWYQRMRQRPAVQKSLEEEGLNYYLYCLSRISMYIRYPSFSKWKVTYN
ncbi:glutathione binding-like protein [Klebsiella oxytoca]|uniref:glutathione binding-like protein n=1 Tax=Klebsiella oxytoca TaxID=571 RepID=UPI002B4002BD|nr:glutathione binding-like protein [Klebsiella oxytoca]